MLTLGALSFLTPLILITLASLPLIWWLLRATPPSPDRIKFPAFIILRQLSDDDKTPDRTPWWLLLLRLLLAAFVIIGLAGPILNAPDVEPADGPLILIVDNSYAAAPGWSLRRTAIERAGEEARQTRRPVFIITTAPAYPAGTPLISGPLTADEIRNSAASLEPLAFAADRQGAISTLETLDDTLTRVRQTNPGGYSGDPTFLWLSDHLASEDVSVDARFEAALKERGDVIILTDDTRPPFAIHPSGTGTTGNEFEIRRLTANAPWEGDVVALARDGRELARQVAFLNAGEKQTDISLDLPLALQNELASIRLESMRTAASLWLVDARDRRALIGLQRNERDQSAALLSGNHYIREALKSFAEFQTGDINTLIASDVSVIVLDDVGRLREDDEALLADWIDRGGVLIRFAGPTLADAALDGTPPLLPVELRRGERAFGGALTWDTPQPLGEFASDSPFADLKLPTDVFIRQQVLATPGGETSNRTWASLVDGTPLVTGRQSGNGLIVFFHVTATPVWSDLPLSEVFIAMLRKLTFLSTLGPETLEETVNDQTVTRYAPLRILDGFGRFQRPSSGLGGITLADTSLVPTPQSPPGLYGTPDTPIAMNTISQQTNFSPLQVGGVTRNPYTEATPQLLGRFFFMGALIALLLDMFAILFLNNKLGLPNRKVSHA